MSVIIKSIEDQIDELQRDFNEEVNNIPMKECARLNLKRLSELRQPYTNLGSEVLISRELVQNRSKKLQEMLMKLNMQKVLPFYGVNRRKEMQAKMKEIQTALDDLRIAGIELLEKINKAKVIDPEILNSSKCEDNSDQLLDETPPGIGTDSENEDTGSESPSKEVEKQAGPSIMRQIKEHAPSDEESLNDSFEHSSFSSEDRFKLSGVALDESNDSVTSQNGSLDEATSNNDSESKILPSSLGEKKNGIEMEILSRDLDVSFVTTDEEFESATSDEAKDIEDNEMVPLSAEHKNRVEDESKDKIELGPLPSPPSFLPLYHESDSESLETDVNLTELLKQHLPSNQSFDDNLEPVLQVIDNKDLDEILNDNL